MNTLRRIVMRKSILPVCLALFSLVLVGCGSTKNTYVPSETNAGSVSLAFSSQNENKEAKQALQHALSLFEDQRFIEAEQAFWELDQEYTSNNNAWNIRVVSAALTCQLAQGDIHRFNNDVQILRHYASGVSNLPRQTQVLLSMAQSMESLPQSNSPNAYVDTRISDWFSALKE